jgi:tellurite resistance protein TerC
MSFLQVLGPGLEIPTRCYHLSIPLSALPSVILPPATGTSTLPCLADVIALPAAIEGQPAATITTAHWIAFAAFVTVMLILDLTVFHRKAHEPTLRESGFWTCFWATLALAFNGLVWWWLGGKAAVEFLTGYLVEWSLSMDNVFVFAVIFAYFGVPLRYQYRVLFWGILGAVLMRLTFVLLGAELVQRYQWVMWFFGAFLVYTGIKLAWGDEDHQPGDNAMMRLFRRFLPMSTQPAGDRFFVREEGRLMATPLFLVLLVVESTDVLFAVDSVPAIFGVVDQRAHYFRFIVFTSNVFAILGLRALYFLLAGVMHLFRFLNYGLSAVLVFVGLKMIVETARHTEWLAERGGWDPHAEGHLVPPWLSLLVIVALIGTSVAASLLLPERQNRSQIADDHEPPAAA